MLPFLLLLLFGTAQPGEPAAGPPEDMTVSAIRGEAFAKGRCASCHAVGLDDTSTISRAPPLREIASRYPVEYLEEALAEGIYVAHDGPMPAFRLEAAEIADLTAYLRKLNAEARP